MHCVDNMMLAGLIHHLKNTFEGPRSHGAAVLSSVGTAQPITTTATGTTFMEWARCSSPATPSLLNTTLGFADKFSLFGAAKEFQDASAALWVRAENMERGARERGIGL